MSGENNGSDLTHQPSQPDRKKIQDYVYRFCDQIGTGNFSKVFKGLHEPTGKQVAIKTIELSSLANNRLLELLNTETTIIKTLQHPNVIHCEEILSSYRNCYIITELCEGGDLEKRLKSTGPLKETEICQIAADVYLGLRYLASNHIVHRDLKVSNVFLHNGKYKIADFGFAQVSQHEFQDISVGSPIYMSPEGYIENKYGPKTDVWAFGVLLFELASGRTPCCDCKTESELKSKMEKQLGVSDLANLNVSAELKDLIIQCLTINSKLRISIDEIKLTEWMKKALTIREESTKEVQRQKENVRNMSSYEDRLSMINMLRKNNHELLKKLEGNNSKDDKLRKTDPKPFAQKFNNFLRVSDKEGNAMKDYEESKEMGKRHATVEKPSGNGETLDLRRLKNEEGEKNPHHVFYSPKSGFSRFSNNFKIPNREPKIQDLLPNRSDLQGTANKAILSKKAVMNSCEFTQKDSRENLSMNQNQRIVTSPHAVNQSSDIRKSSPTCHKSDLLNEYKKYFNNERSKPNSSDIVKTLEKKPAGYFRSKQNEQVLKQSVQISKNSEKSVNSCGANGTKKNREDSHLRETEADSRLKETGVETVITRAISFSDCIGIIHYCRLSFKFSCVLEEVGSEDSSKNFFRSWTIQLLKELMNKIKRCEIIYGNQNLINNPSMGSKSPSVEKKQRLQAVTEEYLLRYRDSDYLQGQNFTLKEASNLIYELYLKKLQEFKTKSKEKHGELFLVMMCYLRILDKQTKNLMEYVYEVRSAMDGRGIEKLLSLKASSFNRKVAEEIIEDGHSRILMT